MHGLSLGTHFTDGHISKGQSGHLHHARHSHRAESSEHHGRFGAKHAQESASTSGADAQGSIKQALVNQIRVTLSQRFDLHQSSVTVAGATADEQAGNDLAGTVSSALNSLNGSSPTDAVAAVNDTATGAIQQATQDLSSGNSSGAPNQIDSAVSQVQGQLQSLYAAYLAHAGSSQGADSVTATGAKLISNAKGMLEIHTREGDTITLSFASKTGVSVQNLQANSGGAQLAASDIQALSRSRVTISVQGDLNAGELQAVQDLVGQVNHLADGFFGGDVGAALSLAGGLNFDSSQLADYSLHLALKQTFDAYGLNLVLPPAAATGQTPAAANDGSVVTATATPAAEVIAPSTDTGTTAAAPSVAANADSVAANNGTAAGTKTALTA